MPPTKRWWNDVYFYDDARAKAGKYAIWNNARYSFDSPLKNGLQKWQCTVPGCNNCIYLHPDDSFVKYCTHTDHDGVQVQFHFGKHSADTHKIWSKARITTQEAGQHMKQLVSDGSNQYDAYSQYILQNANIIKSNWSFLLIVPNHSDKSAN